MEIAAAKLEALVNQANTILDSVANNLDTKFTKEIDMQTSVLKIVEMVHELSNDLEKMKQESETLVNEQEAVKEELVSLLPEISKKLHFEGHTGNSASSNNNNNDTCSDLINKLDNMNV